MHELTLQLNNLESKGESNMTDPSFHLSLERGDFVDRQPSNVTYITVSI